MTAQQKKGEKKVQYFSTIGSIQQNSLPLFVILRFQQQKQSFHFLFKQLESSRNPSRHHDTTALQSFCSKTSTLSNPDSGTGTWISPSFSRRLCCRPTHPEEKVQGPAAVEATAEGDEDDGVGRPHSRPGWAGLPQRVLYSFQAPGPDPAHYHQGSCGPSRPGWEGRGDGGGEGQGGRDKEGSQSVSQRGLE